MQTSRYGTKHQWLDSPLTTSLAGLEARASCEAKEELVTWHSHSPSSKVMLASRTSRLQSPRLGFPAHWYFPG